MLRERWKSNLWSIKYVILMTSLTRLLLLLKAFLVGKYFMGTSQFFQYELVFAEISLVSYIVSNGFMVSAIWNYKYIEELEGKEAVRKYINKSVNLVALLVLVGLGLLGLSIGLDLDKFRPREVKLLYFIGLPIILFSSIKVLYTGYLQAQHGFFAGNRGNLARVLLYLGFLLCLRERLTIYGLMAIGSLTSIVQMYIGYRGMGKHRYSYGLDLGYNEALKRFLRDGFLIMLINLVYEISLIWHRDNIVTIFLMGIVLNAIATVIYPVLAEDYIRYKLGNYKDLSIFNYNFSRTLGSYLNILLIFLVVIYFQSKNLKILLDLRVESDLNLLFYWGTGIFAISIIPLIIRSLVAIEEFKTIYINMFLGALAGFIIRISSGYTRIVFDNALFVFSILGLLGINRKTKFLGSKEFKLRCKILRLPLILIIISNKFIYLIYKRPRLNIKNQELFYLAMAVITTLIVFIPAYDYSRHKYKNKEDQESIMEVLS